MNELGQGQGGITSWGVSQTQANKARPLGALDF